MPRRTWAFAFVACSIAVGCAALAGIEDTTTVRDDQANDAGTDSGIDGELDEIPDATEPAVDGAACADAAARVRASSVVEIKTSTGVICPGPERILEIDDKGVILDSTGASPATRWIDQTGKDRVVHGCVGAQFDGGLTAILLRARMVGEGCATNCQLVDGGCNTYLYAGVWRRLPDGGMYFIEGRTIDRSVFTEKVVLIDDGGTVEDPFIVICRTSLADRRDDVDVDYVGGCR